MTERALGEQLRALRLQHEISLRELARRATISAAHLSDIEHGRRNPSGGLLEILGILLGFSVISHSRIVMISAIIQPHTKR